MEYVILLVADPRAPVLDDNMADVVWQALRALTDDVSIPRVKWLTRGIACEFTYYHANPERAINAARSAIPEARVDICWVPRHGRRKRLLVADMDSTIIPFETIDEVAAKTDAKIREQIVELTKRAMAGELDYQAAYQQRIKLLEGLPTTLLDSVLERIEYTNGARELVATMRASGAVCALATSGLSIFADHVAEVLGFDHAWGNQLEIFQGRITGRIIDPIRDGNTKLNTLISLCKQYDICTHDSMAVGDGANDVKMIVNAGLGVAFHAKPVVTECADARIDFADLTALLYLQGYSIEEFCC